MGEDNQFRKAPILVVDDDPELRKALGRILRHEGHEVLEAADGPSALALARETMAENRGPALLVLDYMMPGMDGEMVLAALRQEHDVAAPPTVLLTACASQSSRAEEIGAKQGLMKPFRVEDLLRAVETHRRTRKTDA